MSKKKLFIDLENIPPKEKTYLTHNFHPYPAKYIPHIPKEIIKFLDMKEGDTILDPFSGSGTTLVESNLLGLNAIGIDSNPIACLVSKVKSTTLNNKSLYEVENCLSRLRNLNVPEKISSIILPEFKNRDHWFQRNMIEELTVIKNIIEETLDEDAKDLLKVALSAIVVKASNQENDTRWAAKDKKLDDGFAIRAFEKKVTDMLLRMQKFNVLNKGNSKVYRGDSRNMSIIPDESIDGVITSPPYLNSYDYYLYHKLRMFILGYDHYDAQDKEIGSRHKHCDKNEGIESYIESINDIVQEMGRVLKNDKFAAIVIGDSIYKKILIKMDIIYNDIFSSNNFRLIDSFSFSQRKYTRAFTPNQKTGYKESHILIYQKM